ncbi:stage V sporulation protein AD [Bacillus safensis FO-36b] [Bacillus safensis subsp. safensis]
MDFGITDPFDMGSAMAPAAADTIKQHLEDLGRTVDDYDLILTGDLSGIGSPILKDLLKEDGIQLGRKHDDCGLIIYTPDQNVFAGGSGCACSAIVTFVIFLRNESREFAKSTCCSNRGVKPMMVQQKRDHSNHCARCRI